MATQITATTPRTRPAPRLGVLEVAILAVIVVAVIGVGVWSQAGSTRDVTTHSPAYGMGYPLHGGLAGRAALARCRRSTWPVTTGPAIRSMAVSPAEPHRQRRGLVPRLPAQPHGDRAPPLTAAAMWPPFRDGRRSWPPPEH